MAKRFFDTAIFDDEWFFELSKDGKLFWIYFLSKCDNAGILKLNPKLAKFQTGVNSIDTVLEELGNRLVRVSEQIYFCPKFIDYQYPNFPQSNAPQQKQVIELLKKSGLWDEKNKQYRYGIYTVSIELPNSYGNGKGNGDGNGEDNKGVEKKISEPEPETEVAEIMQHPYLEKIKSEYPILLKMDNPLTEKEAENLENDLGDELVYEKLEAMANRKGVLKDYTSVNLTIRTWSKFNKNNGKSTTNDKPKRVGRISEQGIRNIFECEIPVIFPGSGGNGGNDQ